MSAETIPSDVATDLDCIRWYVECLDAVAFKRRAVAGLAEAEGSYTAAMKRLTDRSTRPAEPAAPVAEAGDGEVALKSLLAAIQLGHAACDADESSFDLSAFREAYGAHNAIEQLLANLRSTLEAERARADEMRRERDAAETELVASGRCIDDMTARLAAAEQRAADALASIKELEFGAGFEAAFDAVVRPGSRYENWRPADDPAEIVTDLYNDLEDALARAKKKGAVWAAAQSLFASASTTYRKRNGQIGSIEGDDGEISYIVPFDAVETLRMAAAEQAFASSGSDTAEGALAEAREDGWRSIAPEDCEVATVQTFGTITLRNSHPAWVRDDDGRTYEAVWTVDDRGRAYWWDIEAESPVDPVAIYPHPLAARASREAQPATDGGDNG